MEKNKIVLEAGEEEEQDKEENAEENKEEGSEASNEGQDKETDIEATLAVEEIDLPFSGLDLRRARCFGYIKPDSSNWKFLANLADDIGWKLIDADALDKSLSLDVENSYLRIAEFTLVNLDDNVAYSLWFDNNKALWGVSIKDSPKAEMTVEERADFFKSDIFKKIAKKTYFRLTAAKDAFYSIVDEHLKNAELLLVDTVKLSAILHFLDTQYFLENLLNGKYLNY